MALKNESSVLLLSVKNISDGRCVNHLDCSDPGAATVRVELSDNRHSRAESLLHLGNIEGERKETDNIAFRLDDNEYVVYLHSVNPHPTEIKDGVQTAEISVRLKN